MMSEFPCALDEPRVDFPEFLTIMARRGPSTHREGKEDILEAFRVFDKDNNGFISASDLREVLTSFGMKLDESQVEEMFRISKCVDDNDQVKYKQLIDTYF